MNYLNLNPNLNIETNGNQKSPGQQNLCCNGKTDVPVYHTPGSFGLPPENQSLTWRQSSTSGSNKRKKMPDLEVPSVSKRNKVCDSDSENEDDVKMDTSHNTELEHPFNKMTIKDPRLLALIKTGRTPVNENYQKAATWRSQHTQLTTEK